MVSLRASTSSKFNNSSDIILHAYEIKSKLPVINDNTASRNSIEEALGLASLQFKSAENSTWKLTFETL